MIIEPQLSIRTTLEMTLSCEGLRVFLAPNLDSALLQLRVLQPDLIIISFDGQGADESAAVAQIKALSSAPLLALGDRNGGSQRPGIADTLPHPLNVGHLCVKVGGLLADDTRPSYHLAEPLPGAPAEE